LVDHLFRRESGKMVSVLTRIFGLNDMELAEDVVQETMFKALQEWPFHGVPENPSAWLYKVARNKAIDTLRRQKRLVYQTDNVAGMALVEKGISGKIDDLFLDHEIKDSQLRMIFACCSPEINTESQIALTLKTLCGFSIKEIARAFVTNEETINKRLVRAKQKLREAGIGMEVPMGLNLTGRLNAVLKTIYLLFNEGYNASAGDLMIRKDVCLEAMRLGILLSEQTETNTLETKSIMALMCFHAARFDSRIDNDGAIVLLKDQDRNLWEQELIRKGYNYLNEGSEGFAENEYYIEANIMAVHCSAVSYQQTDWPVILQLYESLQAIKDTPIVRLNKAIVMSQIDGANAAIDYILNNIEIKNYYLYHAVLGELYIQSKQPQNAKGHLELALKLTDSKLEKELIERKMGGVSV